jgi:hypothetical protein
VVSERDEQLREELNDRTGQQKAVLQRSLYGLAFDGKHNHVELCKKMNTDKDFSASEGRAAVI